MSDDSINRDEQWSILLTRCHGPEVQADMKFKAGLLDELKRKTAQNLQPEPAMENVDDRHWQKLLSSAYVPCHADDLFKSRLLGQLKARQGEMRGAATTTAAAESAAEETGDDPILGTILKKSYQPVEPRPDFQTRLLENLKERQRNTTILRRKSRRRMFFLSAVSSVAAAAMVVFVVTLIPRGMPNSASPATQLGGVDLPIPEELYASKDAEPAPEFSTIFASANDFSAGAEEDGVETAVLPAAYRGYRAGDAFAGDALPERVIALRDIEMNKSGDWVAMRTDGASPIETGMSFRSVGAMGHMRFEDGSLLSISPDSELVATREGLSLKQGFMLVSVPDETSDRFRLHFPERDIAIEPGTDIAVLVEPESKYADGGAPAPMLMVVDRKNSPGGLALAKGKNGIGPLFAKQLYRLDKYVTPALPGRTMCDTECEDLDKMFKMDLVLAHQPDRVTPASYGSAVSSGLPLHVYDRPAAKSTVVFSPAGYSKKGDRWVADTYGNQPVVRIKYLSDEYFGFANARRDLALALALGGKVVIDAGDEEFYEIHE